MATARKETTCGPTYSMTRAIEATPWRKGFTDLSMPLFCVATIEWLIAAVMPIMSVYRLPQGQYGCSAHVINLPQDVVSFANSLPRLLSELDVIVVRKEDSNQSHHDFRVRRTIVEQALQWLISNNIYYRADHIHINQETLACLPQHGCLSNIRSVPLDSSEANVETDPTPSDEELYDYHVKLPQSFVPSTSPSMTEQEAVRHSVQQRQSSQLDTFWAPFHSIS